MGGHTLQVLVVDDNRDGADTLAALVESAGYSVRVAYGGQQALDLAAQAPPDEALIDIAMPQLDGEEVARRIRAEPWGARNFLVAITGRGQAEDRQRTLASGFDRHLVKPVDPEQIVDMLADRCHRTGRG
jgi:CheY-like chemotaxis protein